MRIVRLDIERFRSVSRASLFPGRYNVYLGPNNLGKTTVLEALNLLLNPEIGSRATVVDENDFYRRDYLPPAAVPPDAAEVGVSPLSDEASQSQDGQASSAAPEVSEDADSPPSALPTIRIEAVIADLSPEDVGEFPGSLVPWDAANRVVIEASEEGDDPFAIAEKAIRVCFEAWYDAAEDDFACASFFRTDPQATRDACASFTKYHKRHIGFLIYRDFRALQRPITLEPFALFWRLLGSQDATPKHFERVLGACQ